MAPRNTIALPLTFTLLVGCQGVIGGAGGYTAIRPPNTGPGSDPPDVPYEPRAPIVCEDSIAPGARTPMRRLTWLQYNNAVRDLLGTTTNPASDDSK